MTTPFLIDAYNLLFWCLEGENLERERAQLIHEINFHAKRRRLDVTLVFDATWTNDPLARSHFDALEIVFTAKNVTADEYILELVQSQPKVIVVTSDKSLARLARQSGAKTASTPEFYHWLIKSKAKTKERQAPPKIDFSNPKVVLQEGSLLWYQLQFEAKLKKQDPK